MAKTTFVSGSQLTPAIMNAINNPVFVTTADDDGEIPKITDNDLSDASDQIKAGWYAFRDGLKVTAGTGLVCNFAAGSVTLPLGTIQAITAGTITMVPGTTSTTTNYIWVNTSGSVVTGLTYPTVSLPLASVVTASGAISSITDLRPRFMVQPVASAIKVFGGTGEQGNYSLASGTASLSDGFYYYNNFTVASGATLTISRFAKIHCSGTVTIAGTITVTTFSTGGTSFGTGSSVATSNIGGLSGSGPGAGAGSGSGSSTYSYAAAPYGSGGASGFYSSTGSSSGTISSGGAGGGGLWIEAAGAISVTGTGVITARGGNGVIGVSGTGTPSISGGGGGSGGLILLSSLVSVTVSDLTTLDIRGGNGANAAAGSARGGGGGGGGTIVFISPSNVYSGTIQRDAGTNGSDLGSSLGGGDGGSFGGTGANGSTGTGSSIGQIIPRVFRAVG